MNLGIVAVTLVAIGIVIDEPGVAIVGVLTGLVTWSASLWSRRGLDGVRYRRSLRSDRVTAGDGVEIEVTIQNRKALPLAWLTAEDHVTEGLTLADRELPASDRPGLATLRHAWSLAPYREVTRSLALATPRRGRYAFGVVRLTVADLFGRGVASRDDDLPMTLLVRPRSVPVHLGTASLTPLGRRPEPGTLLEDPARFAGTRPFQLGDPLRRIHHRASARSGRLLSKRYDAATAATAMVAMDVQTLDGPTWLLHYDAELAEALAVAGASLVRHLLSQGTACGLAVNGWTYTSAWETVVGPSLRHDQLARLLDVLARASPTASVPFRDLLSRLPTRMPRGATLVTLGVRDLADSVPAIRRLRASGFEVRHVLLGPRAAHHVATARRLGLDALVGHLDPGWRTSRALSLAA